MWPDWYLVLLVISFIAGGVWAFLSRRATPWERFGYSLTPLLVCALVGVLLSGMIFSLTGLWNAARLAATFALKRGYQLYYPGGEGPMLGTIYGPFGILWFWPATWFSRPTGALLLGCFMNVLTYFLPFLWLFRRLYRGAVGTWWGAFLMILACLNAPFSIFCIHSDAPSLAFALCACISLLNRKGDHENRDFFVAALFASLAFWSKQTISPIIVALPLFMVWREPRKKAWKFLKMEFFVFTAVTLVVFLFFDAKNLILNAFIEPIAHVDRPQVMNAKLFWEALQELLLHAALPALVAGLAFWKLGGWRRLPVSVHLLLLTSLLLVPTSLISRMKPGGMGNSFYCNYFLIAAAGLMLTDVLLNLQTKNEKIWVRGGLLILVGVGLYLQVRVIPLWLPRLSMVERNSEELVYEVTREYPGMFYFPWQPLGPLMAEGKLYNFGDAVWGREDAGFPPTQEHFQGHVPRNTLYLAYIPGYQQETYMLKYFPKFTKSLRLAFLPGYQVWTSPEVRARLIPYQPQNR